MTDTEDHFCRSISVLYFRGKIDSWCGALDAWNVALHCASPTHDYISRVLSSICQASRDQLMVAYTDRVLITSQVGSGRRLTASDFFYFCSFQMASGKRKSSELNKSELCSYNDKVVFNYGQITLSSASTALHLDFWQILAFIKNTHCLCETIRSLQYLIKVLGGGIVPTTVWSRCLWVSKWYIL